MAGIHHFYTQGKLQNKADDHYPSACVRDHFCKQTKTLLSVILSVLITVKSLFVNGHLCKTDSSLKWSPRVGPCFSLLLLVDS